MPYSPLGRGFLTGSLTSAADLGHDDTRKDHPRFTPEAFDQNMAIAAETTAVAAEVGATPAQVALAWLLAQGEGIAPIPCTRKVHRLEENVAADDVVLSPAQLERLTDVPAAVGGHHTDEQMTMIER